MPAIKTTAAVAVAVALTSAGTALAGGYVISSTKQIKPSVRRALTGQRGPQGPQGTPGAPGVQGPAGPAGIPTIFKVAGPEVTVNPGQVIGAQAYCPAGTHVIGTGFDASISSVGFVQSYDTFVGGGFVNNRSISVTVSVQALCTSTSSDRMLRNHSGAFDDQLAALRSAAQ